MNRPGFPEAILLGSGGHGLTGDLGIVARLGFGGRDVADGLEEASVVEPVHPFQRLESDIWYPRAQPKPAELRAGSRYYLFRSDH